MLAESAATSGTICEEMKKVSVSPFSMLVNSYLLKYSMTPEKLEKLAKMKHAVSSNNLRRNLLHKTFLQSVISYNEWSSPKKPKTTKLPPKEIKKEKRVFIKIAKRKKDVEKEKEISAKRQHLEDGEQKEKRKTNKIEEKEKKTPTNRQHLEEDEQIDQKLETSKESAPRAFIKIVKRKKKLEKEKETPAKHHQEEEQFDQKLETVPNE